MRIHANVGQLPTVESRLGCASSIINQHLTPTSNHHLPIFAVYAVPNGVLQFCRKSKMQILLMMLYF